MLVDVRILLFIHRQLQQAQLVARQWINGRLAPAQPKSSDGPE